MLELALTAPIENGLPRAICFFPQGEKPYWLRGSRAFEIIDDFHLADAATTGFNLLEWHEMVRPDPRIPKWCSDLGRVIAGLQDKSGAFPSWVALRGNEFIPDSVLSHSAQTAAPLMFLARLNRLFPSGGMAAGHRGGALFHGTRGIPN